ncbi:YdcF family protein [Paenibacillus sp. HB172176]|uniref:YdcF family protein n=1 Tax=Paenibacillus sp. HB172176 TaxID=2493690 RepID=UPI0014390D36|nr:YdcF family protein [Paenibacillus sp. HB172176]
MKTVSRKRSRPRKRKKSFRPWLLLFRFIQVGLLALLVWCGYMLWLIQDYKAMNVYPHADAGIVLGAALWNDEPSPALRERLDYAIALYEQGAFDKLILSGGHGGLISQLTEAEGMKAYLVSRGIPENALLLENEAKDTYQNLLFSSKIAMAEDLHSFIIITHKYHAERAGEMASYIGLESFEVAGVKSKVLNPYYHHTREILALTKWKLDYLLLWSGIRSSGWTP